MSAIFYNGQQTMRVESVTVSNFRNLVSMTLKPGAGINVLIGDNGSGKTNLLEAIFTLCLGRSQRAAADTVLIRTNEDLYRLQGRVETKAGSSEIAVAYQRGGRKKITIDSVPARASELYNQMCLVAAGPEDSDILAGPPSTRRLFLDLYLSQLSQTYLADLTDYQKALSQKNAALRNEMDATPFDPLLVTYGSRIMQERAGFLKGLAGLACTFYREIAEGETIMMDYKPKVPISPEGYNLEAITTAFESALDKNSERERVMQTSLVGPHRDEVEFTICDLPARTHGSQGQWRSAAVSLKLGIFELLRQKRGVMPIMLLDEIFAELDTKRAECLARKFVGAGQLFLTTAVEPPESLANDACRFTIKHGTVKENNQ